MARDEATEAAEVVAKRREYLEVLGDGPLQKTDVVDALDAPRSTVDRAVRELEAADLVRRAREGYVTTPTGELLLEERRTYLDRVAAAVEAAPVLDALPRPLPFDASVLVGAEVLLPEAHAPESALRRNVEVTRSATRLRGLAPVVLSLYVDVLHEQVVNEGLSVELVATPQVVETLRAEYADRVAEMEATGRFDLLATDRDLPYALWVVDAPDGPHAGLVVYSEAGIEGLLLSDAEAMVGWAEREYRSYREAASPPP